MNHELEQLYNELYRQAEKATIYINPCEVTNGRCRRGYFCCDGCRYLVDNHCSTTALLCRLWFCSEVAKHLSITTKEELHYIGKRALNNNLLTFRGNYSDSQKMLLFGRKVAVLMPWDEVIIIKQA